MRFVSDSECYKSKLTEMKHEIHETLAHLSNDLTEPGVVATRSLQKILSIINKPVSPHKLR